MTIALDIFRALADATRLRVLALLRSMELSVGELAQVLGSFVRFAPQLSLSRPSHMCWIRSPHVARRCRSHTGRAPTKALHHCSCGTH